MMKLLCITIALSVLLLCHVDAKPLALMRAHDQDYARCRRSIEDVQTECMNTEGPNEDEEQRQDRCHAEYHQNKQRCKIAGTFKV